MKRNRFVNPDAVQIQLGDVAQRVLARLVASPIPEPSSEKEREARRKAVAEAERRVTLAKADGDWIEVRKHLNTGEAQAMFSQMRAKESDLQLDAARIGISRVMAYLLDWSFMKDGQKVPVTLSAVQGLFPDDFSELREAIDQHVEQMEAELETEKNERAGARPSSATFTSAA